VLLWDFDNTLGSRRGIWGHPLVDVLRRHDPESEVTGEEIGPHLQEGFPWHQPEVAHPELNEPDAWWEAMEVVFHRAYTAVGIKAEQASRLASDVRATFTHPNGWHLFDDTLETLETLRNEGWRHVVVSNHIPELPDLIDHLGLSPLLDRVYTSALVGYEKPHPELYQMVLDWVGEVDKIWMIGDNIEADVRGANRMGIPAILVRKYHEEAEFFCPTVADAIEVLSDGA